MTIFPAHLPHYPWGRSVPQTGKCDSVSILTNGGEAVKAPQEKHSPPPPPCVWSFHAEEAASPTRFSPFRLSSSVSFSLSHLAAGTPQRKFAKLSSHPPPPLAMPPRPPPRRRFLLLPKAAAIIWRKKEEDVRMRVDARECSTTCAPMSLSHSAPGMGQRRLLQRHKCTAGGKVQKSK